MGSSCLSYVTRGILPGEAGTLVQPLVATAPPPQPISIRDWAATLSTLANEWSLIDAAVSSLLATANVTFREVDGVMAQARTYRRNLMEHRALIEDMDFDLFAPSFSAAGSISGFIWFKELNFQITQLLAISGDALDALSKLSASSEFEYHLVRATDTLQNLAVRYMGSYENWRRIVDANAINIAAFPDSYLGQSIRIPRS